MAGAREFLNSPNGRFTAGAFAVCAIVLLAYFGWQRISNNPVAISNARMFVDSTTGKAFAHDLKLGETIPVKAPSGGMTGYPSETCFWTKDGKSKSEPTYVILNQTLNKPGPTFCPDCGRLVVGYNPGPSEFTKAPPTESEYRAR